MHADEGFLINIVKVALFKVEKWVGTATRNSRDPGQYQRRHRGSLSERNGTRIRKSQAQKGHQCRLSRNQLEQRILELPGSGN
jgi:hypothetical protein